MSGWESIERYEEQQRSRAERERDQAIELLRQVRNRLGGSDSYHDAIFRSIRDIDSSGVDLTPAPAAGDKR